MKLFNTLGRKLETFKPFDPQNVKVYTCGPTVYSSPHIGNYAAYIYWDLLVRLLKFNGYTVHRVLNLTDVGHLSSDADEGEDKLEKGARTSGKTVWEVADYYAHEFLTGFHALNLVEPTKIAKATDYIAADIQVVDALTKKGYTYETSDGIYFDTSKFAKYADFAKLSLRDIKAGSRVALSSEKRNPSDFAVWKFIRPEEKHDMRWDYLSRPGYPGWHLECSTIIHSELGETIDIHTGGIDHIPVHHTNEIAQSEAAFDKKLAKYWLHCNHLLSDGQKISKSLGNGYTLKDLANKGYSPLDFKMWVLQGHYRSERDFSLSNLEAARLRRLNWRNRIAKARQIKIPSTDLETIISAVNDDLGSPASFALIDNLDLSFENWQLIDELFGLNLIQDAPPLSAQCEALLAERQTARLAKDFTKSDQLREQLAKYNIAVLDTANGQLWQYLR